MTYKFLLFFVLEFETIRTWALHIIKSDGLMDKIRVNRSFLVQRMCWPEKKYEEKFERQR